MEFLEKDLENIIWESDNEKLLDRGLCCVYGCKLYRQLKIGNYGVADLISVGRSNIYEHEEPHLIITVFELKKDKVGISAFLQAIRYCKGIKQYLEKRKFYNFKLNISLIGKDIDMSGDFIYITDLIKNTCSNIESFGVIDEIDFYIYKYELDGLYFDRKYEYSLIDEGF